MRPGSRQGSNKPLIVGLLLTLLLLLFAAVGVFVYDSYQPKVMASGHRWILYPQKGNTEHAHGDSSTEQLSYGGNVKLFTLVYAEFMTGEDSDEQIREAKCHVLIDLPSDCVMRVTGGGSSADGSLYRQVQFRTRDKPDTAQQEKQLRLAFHVEKRELNLMGQTVEHPINEKGGEEAVVAEETPHGPLSTAGGNIFVVRLDDNFNVAEVIPLQEHIDQRLDDETVSRLMDEQ